MVRYGCSDIHHVLDRAVYVDIVILITHLFLERHEDGCLAYAGLGHNDWRDLVAHCLDDLLGLVEVYHQFEIYFCHALLSVK
jgi:hypothetical protein